ncbi:MAG: hypothetical protein D6761_12200 [Candidatus Dadabacteria bacterium]|nr:MAG: hypothetical protein D6761_12200 [Candidatus Dadabacteria bacterium]
MRGVIVVVLLCLLAAPVRADPSYQWSPRKKKVVGALVLSLGEAMKYGGVGWLVPPIFYEQGSGASIAGASTLVALGEAGTFAGLGLIIGGARQREPKDAQRRALLESRSRKAWRAGWVLTAGAGGLFALSWLATLLPGDASEEIGWELVDINQFWAPQVTHLGLWTLTPAIATRRTLRRGPYQQARWSLRPWVAANRSGTTTAGLTLRF